CLTRISDSQIYPSETSARALLKGPAPAFRINSGFVFNWSRRCTPSGVGGGIAHSLPCLRHALRSVEQLSGTSLQFRAQPVRRRRIAFAQLQPVRGVFVVARIVGRPAKILRVFNLPEVCFFDNG